MQSSGWGSHPARQVLITGATANHSVCPCWVSARLSALRSSVEASDSSRFTHVPSSAHHPASVREVWTPSHFRFPIIREHFILHLILWLTKIFSLGIKNLFSSLCSAVNTFKSVHVFSFSNFYSRWMFFSSFFIEILVEYIIVLLILGFFCCVQEKKNKGQMIKGYCWRPQTNIQS